MNEVTRILAEIERGDSHATQDLLPIIYAELRQLAAARMAHEKPGQTLQATALVHEAYLRLMHDAQTWDNRAHFFAAAAEAMRRILIEHARRRKSQKQGGGRERVALDADLPVIAAPVTDVDDLLALDEALTRLAAEDPAKATLVKLLYFAGFNLEDAGSAMGISRATAHRHWLFAKAWLHDAMRGKVGP